MTEWEPATETEAAMRDALRAGDQELYFRILARTDLLLPVSAEALAGRAPMGWGTWTTGGRTHVLAFTSTAALRACLAENAGSTRRAPYSELATGWPNPEWWLAVNPGLPIEGYLPAWFVSQLSRGDVRLPGRSMGARARLEQVERAARARATAAVPRRPPDGAPRAEPEPAGPFRAAEPDPMPFRAAEPDPMPFRPVDPDPMPFRPVESDAMPFRPGEPDGLPLRSPGASQEWTAPFRPVDADPPLRPTDTDSSGLPSRTPGASREPVEVFRPMEPESSASPFRTAEPDSSASPFRTAEPDSSASPFRAAEPAPEPTEVFRPVEIHPPARSFRAAEPAEMFPAAESERPVEPFPVDPSPEAAEPFRTVEAGSAPGPAVPPPDDPAPFPSATEPIPTQPGPPSTPTQPGSTSAATQPAPMPARTQPGAAPATVPVIAPMPARNGLGGDFGSQVAEDTSVGWMTPTGASRAPASSTTNGSSAGAGIPAGPVSSVSAPPSAGASSVPPPAWQRPAEPPPGRPADPVETRASEGRPGAPVAQRIPPPEGPAPEAWTPPAPERAEPSLFTPVRRPADESSPEAAASWPGAVADGPTTGYETFGRPAAADPAPASRPDGVAEPARPEPVPAPPAEAGPTEPIRTGPGLAQALSGRSFATESLSMGMRPTEQFTAGPPVTEQVAGTPAGTEQFAAGPPGPEQAAGASAVTEQFGAGPPVTEQFGAGPPVTEQFGAGPPVTEQFGAGPPVTEGFSAGRSATEPFSAGASVIERFGAGRASSARVSAGAEVADSSGSGGVDWSGGEAAGWPAGESSSTEPSSTGLVDPGPAGSGPVGSGSGPAPTGSSPGGASGSGPPEAETTALAAAPQAAAEPVPARRLPSDFVPANEVEQSLLDAAGDGSTDTFLSTLLLARVLLPVAYNSAPGSRPGDDGFEWRTELLDGERYVVVFTSPERLGDHLPETIDTIEVKFAQLIRRWPDDNYSFAVNPGTPVGAKLPGGQIVALANWAAEVGLGDDSGEPAPQAPAEEEAPRSTYAPAREDPGRPTMMQKTIAPSQLSYYLDRGYDRVSGFVHRASEVAHLLTPAKLYAALGLNHPGSPFERDAEEIYVLRWPAYRPSLYRIPYGGQSEAAMRAMEGWVIERPPFRGNGFAPGESSDVVAEFKVDSVRLPHGAQLHRIGADGSERLVATLDCDVPVWRRAEED